jgi:hypothetical protein
MDNPSILYLCGRRVVSRSSVRSRLSQLLPTGDGGRQVTYQEAAGTVLMRRESDALDFFKNCQNPPIPNFLR